MAVNPNSFYTPGNDYSPPVDSEKAKASIDDIFDYHTKKGIEANKKIERESFRSIASQKRITQKNLDDYVKANLTASSRIKKAWESTGMGSFFKSIGDFNKASSKIKSGNGTNKDLKAMGDAANMIASAVGEAVKKVVDFVVKQYVQYAQNYEQHMGTTTTNLGSNRQSYSKSLQSINKDIMSTATSMKKVMESMDKLAADGIASNIESLSVLKSMEDKISTTFDAKTIYHQMRLFGTDSGIYEMALGHEAALRDQLQAEYGTSQYISDGVYKQTRSMAQSLLRMQESAEKSIELESLIQEGIGKLYELGLSEAGISDLQQAIQEYSKKGYITSNAGLMAMSNANLTFQDLENGEWGKFIEGYAQTYSDNNTNSRIQAGALSELFGGDAEDYMSSDLAKKLAGLQVDGMTSKEIYKALEEAKSEVKNRYTFQQNVEMYLDKITGLLGGNTLGQVGSGIIGGIGNILGSVAGIGASALAMKFLGGKLGASGGGGLGKLFGGGLGASGGGSVLTGTATASGASAMLAGTSIAGGVIWGGVDAYNANKNNTYGKNTAGNLAGGFFLGNSKGSGDLGNIGKNAGKFALIGAGIGSFIPGVGTVIGGVVGAAVGAIAGIIGNSVAESKKDKEAAGAAANSSTSDQVTVLNQINNSINLQTDKLVACLTNLYIATRGEVYTASAPTPAEVIE